MASGVMFRGLGGGQGLIIIETLKSTNCVNI